LHIKAPILHAKAPILHAKAPKLHKNKIEWGEAISLLTVTYA
jgi:hypothetical protein